MTTKDKFMSINEILMHVVNPSDLENDIPESELNFARQALDSRVEEGYLLAQKLRNDILNYKPYHINMGGDYSGEEVKTYFNLLNFVMEARTTELEQKLEKYFRDYGRHKKSFDSKTGELTEKLIKKLTPTEVKLVMASIYANDYENYKINKTSSSGLDSLKTDKFISKNEVLLHNNPNQNNAFFPLLLVRQKSKLRRGRKYLKRLMIEYTISMLTGEEFNVNNVFFYDYNALRVGAKSGSSKKLDAFLRDAKKDNRWKSDGLWHPKRADRIGSKTHYLIDPRGSDITICLHYLPIIDFILSDFASKTKHTLFERDWYKLFDDEKEKINKAGRKSNYTDGKFEKEFFKRKETKIFARRLESVLGYEGSILK